MKRYFSLIKHIFIIMIIAGSVYHPSYAKKLYKWTDENGKTYFSDKVPPTQKHHKRERLNKIGEVVESIKRVKIVKIKEKTKEELIVEEKIELLKQQQAQQQKKLQEKQKQQDKFLLSTFHTFKSMEISHKGRINSLALKIKTLQDSLVKLQEKLTKQTEKASNDSRNNKKTSEKILDAMSESKNKIKKIELSINQAIDLKKTTHIKQETELKRYLLLMKSKDKKQPIEKTIN